MSESGTMLIWGAGGHAKVVADLAVDQGWHIAGFVARDGSGASMATRGHPVPLVVPESELVACLETDRLPREAVCVALGIGDNATRSSCEAALGKRCAPMLIHSRATVSPSARIGDGTVVFPGAIVNADANVGRGVIVNSAAVIEHDCLIGDGAHVSPGAVLTGNVTVGAMSWIGAGAIILPGVRVGARVIVGAGSVVTRDLDDDKTVVGNPARALEKNT